MKKITVILILTMLMSICIFATVKPNVHRNNVSKESIRKPNVYKKHMPNEYNMKKAIAKSKNKPMAISKEIQARREKQLYPRKIKHNYIH